MATEFAQSATRVNFFRVATERQKNMPGVTLPSFVCKCCRKPKAATGRKQVVKGAPRYGYMCAECAEKEGRE